MKKKSSIFLLFNNWILETLNPSFFLFINIFSLFFAINIYFYRSDISFAKFLLILLILLTFDLCFFSTKKEFSFKNVNYIYLKGAYWDFYVLLVVLASCSEYLYFGSPLLGIWGIGKRTLYANFGFPLIHHITVSSWILVFYQSEKRAISVFSWIFALINPFLLLTRDLMILTFFAFAIKFIIANRNTKIFLFFLILFFLLFGALGNLRSGGLDVNVIPFKFENINNKKSFVWIVTYFTSSWFNFINNIFRKDYFLEVGFLNVFPEVTVLYNSGGLLGFIFFYIFVFFFLMYFAVKKEWDYCFSVLYVNLLYRSIMTIFGRTLFNTNMVYILLVFLGYKLLPFLNRFTFLYINGNSEKK